MSLTKAKLVDYLHKKMGLPKKDCLQIVETFFEEIMSALEKGEEVKLPGLGNFSVVHKKSRPEEILEQEKLRPYLKEMSSALKQEESSEKVCN